MKRGGGEGCSLNHGSNLKWYGEGGEVERFIVWQAQVDVWAATVMRCLVEHETGRGLQQKMYAARNGKMLELAIAQLTGNLHLSVQYWAWGVRAMSETGDEVMHAGKVPSTIERYLCMDRGWSGQ